MDAAAIITACIGQVGTDASRATVLSVLNEAYAQQVADSRWFRTEASIGSTVAGTAAYVVPDTIVEMFAVTVGGGTFEPIGEDVMRRIINGSVSLRIASSGGVYAPGYSSTGSPQITLYPTPSTGGVPITVYAALVPAALTDSSGSVPVTPSDTHSSLIDGTAAILLNRIDERPDLAGGYQTRFDTVTEKIRRRKNALLTGSQPVRLKVQGIDF